MVGPEGDLLARWGRGNKPKVITQKPVPLFEHRDVSGQKRLFTVPCESCRKHGWDCDRSRVEKCKNCKIFKSRCTWQQGELFFVGPEGDLLTLDRTQRPHLSGSGDKLEAPQSDQSASQPGADRCASKRAPRSRYVTYGDISGLPQPEPYSQARGGHRSTSGNMSASYTKEPSSIQSVVPGGPRRDAAMENDVDVAEWVWRARKNGMGVKAALDLLHHGL